MFRTLLLICSLLLAQTLLFAAPASPAKPAAFGVAAHADVNIEWWYVNAHVVTERGRHLALVGSFFRFGNGTSPLDGVSPAPRAHYLIYSVTDLDRKTQRPYSLADAPMVSYLKLAAPFLALRSPQDKGAQALVAALNAGRLPAPHQQIAGDATVQSSPFRLAYGADNTLSADNEANTAYTMNLDAGGADKIHLTLHAQKPPMAVGGTGETGLVKKNDMYYFSLTRCGVGGTIDTGSGPERITSGAAWFDHQWGNSWVASNDGWDWWGIQLDDGTDCLVFRQRDLATGKIFFPLATFMDKRGHQTVTTHIHFTSDTRSVWRSSKTGVAYPLRWTLAFPDRQDVMTITAAVPAQEMPILGPGGGIWEGSCKVSLAHGKRPFVPGTAYMELVGYASPAVKATLPKPR